MTDYRNYNPRQAALDRGPRPADRRRQAPPWRPAHCPQTELPAFIVEIPADRQKRRRGRQPGHGGRPGLPSRHPARSPRPWRAPSWT